MKLFRRAGPPAVAPAPSNERSWPDQNAQWPEHLRAVGAAKGLTMISVDEAQLLYDLAGAVTSGCIVEVGSYRGRSTIALALAAADSVPIYAIEPHETFTGPLGGQFGPQDRAGFFRNMLDSRAYEKVRLVNLSSEVVTPGWDRPVSLLFIDGDHSYDGVVRDYTCWRPHLTADATVVFDDAMDPSIGPRQLIDELVAQGKVRVEREVGKVVSVRVSER